MPDGESSAFYLGADVGTLRTAAKAGDVSAMRELGARLLVGRDAPFEPREGLALIERAAACDDTNATSLLATLKGAGAWTQQSWPDALRLLRRAAELGSQDARAQLIMLASDVEAAAEARTGEAHDVWARLQESINLERWVVPPMPQAVSEAPRIWTVPGFATPEICHWFIGRCQGRLQPSQMFDGQRSRFLATRTCSDFPFTIIDGGVLMVLLRIRISLAVSLPVPHMEPPQIFHYAVGQEIKAHYDSLYDSEHGYGQSGAYRGGPAGDAAALSQRRLRGRGARVPPHRVPSSGADGGCGLLRQLEGREAGPPEPPCRDACHDRGEIHSVPMDSRPAFHGLKNRCRHLENPIRNIILIPVDWHGSMSNIRALAATPFPKS